MSPDFEVAVIGDGILGAFVVEMLTRGNMRVSDIAWFGDQVRFDSHSATSYSGGLVRCGMRHTQQDYALEAFEMWWQHEPSLNRVGSLEAVPDPAFVSVRLAELRGRGVDGRLLSGSQITETTGIPKTRMAAALYEPGAGYVDARGLRAVLLRKAEDAGVSILHHEPAAKIEDHVGALAATIRTQESAYTARFVVVVAGAGTRALVPEWAGLTRLRRIGYGYFSGLLPIGLPTLNDDPYGLWWCPSPSQEHPDRYLVGRAQDETASGCALSVHTPDQEAHIREGLRGYLDNSDEGSYLGGVQSFDVCAPRRQASRQLLKSDSGRVISATNFNGGGFKQAPAVAYQISAMLRRERRVVT